MRERCPSARFAGVAKLPGRRLAFTRWSEGRAGAVPDAVEDPAGEVWGAVYEVTEPDLTELDRFEGFAPGSSRNSYIRRQCTVYLDGDEGLAVAAEAYFAVPAENPGLPRRAYLNQILAGAREWGLPRDYIEQVLEKIEAR